MIQVSHYNFPAKTFYAFLIPEFSGCLLFNTAQSLYTQDMSVFISVDRVFYLYPQLSNFSRYEINTVLPKSNDSEV